MPGPTDPDSSDLDLGRAIDRLFRLPLEEFIEARNTLAGRLRKAGRREDESSVRTLPKPSVTAWAVNQVWWTDRHAFEAMIEAGRRLRDAQQASLRGEGSNVREAVEARQDAIAAVLDLAVRAMGGTDRVGPAMRQRIGATCDALATGEMPPGTRPGRLTQDLQPAGLGALSSLMSAAASAPAPTSALRETRRPAEVMPFTPRAKPAPSPPPGASETAESPQARRRREAGERQQAALVAARDATARADRAVEAAERMLAARRAAVEQAEHDQAAARLAVVTAEEALERARLAESDARAATAGAKRNADAAEVELTRARRAADRARAQLATLERS
jgi:hypothetical protein